jgi:phosphoribosyl 1,2-cyclic phosphodiesterase
MHVRFWGTRGSIASPGPETVRYGGNTTCIEVRTNNDELIILDGGTGIFRLGNALTKRKLPRRISVFVTHTHWDHIQGFPFFVPLFIPHQEINFYGTFDPVYDKSLKEILAGQMEYCYYPVRESELKANISYKSLQDRQSIVVDGVKVTPVMMNHPVLNFGYLIEADGQKVFFTGDHEPMRNIYSPEDEEFEEFEQIITLRNSVLEDVITEVDLVITDSMYTADEYPQKMGWGHGSYQSCIEMADRIDAGKIVLTHHEPTRSDEELDAIYAQICNDYSHVSPELVIAREGMIIDLG